MAKRKKSTFERLTKGPLNRKQRRELGRRLVSDDPGLKIIHPNAGGIDVGNESHFAAVPADRDAQPVQEFGSWTADLHRMGKWLQSCRIDTVVVQATGVYWIPLYDILTEHGIRVVLVNAQHTKNVPGRKSDVQESQWLMKLHTYGLLRDSFRLTENLEGVRTIWRLRDRHVKEAGRAVQHIQKAVTKMNIQLANVISDISGVSGRAIIEAILKGERDPYRLRDTLLDGRQVNNFRTRVNCRPQLRFAHRGNQQVDRFVAFRPRGVYMDVRREPHLRSQRDTVPRKRHAIRLRNRELKVGCLDAVRDFFAQLRKEFNNHVGPRTPPAI